MILKWSFFVTSLDVEVFFEKSTYTFFENETFGEVELHVVRSGATMNFTVHLRGSESNYLIPYDKMWLTLKYSYAL